jgi:hypothetical protein
VSPEPERDRALQPTRKRRGQVGEGLKRELLAETNEINSTSGL